jgi:protein tyrosine phosphatase
MSINEHVPNAYWVKENVFAAGQYPGGITERQTRTKIGSLLDYGIRVFINLLHEGEITNDMALSGSYEPVLMKLAEERGIEVECINFSVLDKSVPDTALMSQVLDTIDGFIKSDRVAYVHCRGGFGRTGTVVGCWLVRHGIKDPASAIDYIRILRRDTQDAWYPSPETTAQCRFVETWQEGQ